MANQLAVESNRVADAIERGDGEGARIGLYYAQGFTPRPRHEVVELTLRTIGNLIAVEQPSTPEQMHALIEKMVAAVCPV